MDTTRCSKCGSTSQTWAAKRQPVRIVSECDACKDRPASTGTMRFTVDAFATRTQFTTATRAI